MQIKEKKDYPEKDLDQDFVSNKQFYNADEDDEKSERKFSKGSRSKNIANKKNFVFKKRVCFFCKNREALIDYKDAGLMKRFVTEGGKISPRRFTGTCAKHQKKLTVEIKKARQMALLHYTDKHK